MSRESSHNRPATPSESRVSTRSKTETRSVESESHETTGGGRSERRSRQTESCEKRTKTTETYEAGPLPPGGPTDGNGGGGTDGGGDGDSGPRPGWTDRVPEQMLLCVSGAAAAGRDDASALDGDYLLALVERSPHRCCWELAVPERCGCDRAELIAVPTADGFTLTAALTGPAAAGPRWRATVRDLDETVSLARPAGEPQRSAGIRSLASVLLIPIPVEEDPFAAAGFDAFAIAEAELDSSSSSSSSCGCEVKIVVVEGAVLIANGEQAPSQTANCAAVPELPSGYVLLKAVVSPEGSSVSWTGGEAVEGKPLERRVKKDSFKKEVVTAKCCESSYTMNVYIVGAEFGGFSPPNNHRITDPSATEPGWDDPEFTVDDRHGPGHRNGPPTGRKGPNQLGQFASIVQVRFKIQPEVLLDDVRAELIREDSFDWNVTRDVTGLRYRAKFASDGRSLVWFPNDVGRSGEHKGRKVDALPGNGADKWYMDDINSNDKDLIPWDESNGYIYDSDRPGNNDSNANEMGYRAFLMYYNFRQWARVRIKKIQGEMGEWQDCSGFFYWHAHRTTDRLIENTWRESVWDPITPHNFVNHVGTGLLPYDPLPPEFADFTIKITKAPPLPGGTVGSDYPSVTITTTPPPAFPNILIAVDRLSGNLPPGLSMDGGVISGTPTTAGTFEFTVVAKSDDHRVLSATQDYTIVVGAQ